jgi:hypothetical protein
MATASLHPDFKEFLRLLNAHGVRYLLVGGYAVSYHGYTRATADIDLWVDRRTDNAERLLRAFHAFGFDVPALTTDVLAKEDQVIRMGIPPFRIEVLTSIDGVGFDECHAARIDDMLDDVPVAIIDLAHLKTNKRASGRHRDLDDLEHLP